jgi:hypothetical protein
VKGHEEATLAECQVIFIITLSPSCAWSATATTEL